jgi:F420-0:gamma-glutamyl ligase
VNKPDLYGRKLKMTYVNVADALATSAVLAMGEADERCPIAVITSKTPQFIEFSATSDPSEISIPWEDDLYRPLFEPRLTLSGK